jgi:hypothetical protein
MNGTYQVFRVFRPQCVEGLHFHCACFDLNGGTGQTKPETTPRWLMNNLSNVKHKKLGHKLKKPQGSFVPPIQVSDKVYSFPGRDLLATRIATEGFILEQLNRAISEEHRQLTQGISKRLFYVNRVQTWELRICLLGFLRCCTKPSKCFPVRKEISVCTSSHSLTFSVQCLQMATAWCNSIDEARGKLAKEYATTICKPSLLFLSREMMEAMVQFSF